VGTMDIEMLVKMITEEVLLKINGKVNYSNKNVLVIFNGSTMGLEESISALKKMKEYGFKMKAVLSEFSLNIVDMNVLNEIFDKENIYIVNTYIDNIIMKDNSMEYGEIYNEDFDLLIGANLSLNTVSKVAVGICDTLPTRLISKCIMNGTRIIAVKDACELKKLDGKKAGYNNIPYAFVSMFKGYLDRLESFGIKLINSNNLFEYATDKVDVSNDLSPNVNDKESCQKKLKRDSVQEIIEIGNCDNAEVEIDKKIISREDIALNSKSKRILIPNYAIITSLAKDLCDELKINLIKR
jgi:ethanolamine utilization protein